MNKELFMYIKSKNEIFKDQIKKHMHAFVGLTSSVGRPGIPIQNFPEEWNSLPTRAIYSNHYDIE